MSGMTGRNTKSSTDMRSWLPVLGTDLEINEFALPADFFPYEGKAWGVLVNRRQSLLIPYCGNTVFFEETHECAEIFRKTRGEIANNPELLKAGRLVGAGETTQHCDGKDGLFSEEQVEQYDNQLMKKPFWQALENMVLDRWMKKLPGAGKTILDLGCGTGRCLTKITEAGHRAVGLDLSYAMLRSIEAKNELAPDKCLLILCSAIHIPLQDKSIDGITCFGTLHHVSSPQLAIQESCRLLKNGAIFQALENNASPFRTLFDLTMKLSPLWEEEAGEHQLISAGKIAAWTRGLPIKWRFDYTVFSLPHFFYMFNSEEFVARLIRLLDFPRAIPGLRQCGGILLLTGTKVTDK
jgi:ubiquinone/menaquinone biosynthesis C-methylase UbiE